MSQALLQIRTGLPHTLSVAIVDAAGDAITGLTDVRVTLRTRTGDNVTAPDGYWPRAMAGVGGTPGTYRAQLTTALGITVGAKYDARVTCTVAGEAVTVDFEAVGVKPV